MEELNSIISEFNETLVKKIINGDFKFIKQHQTSKKQYWTIEVDEIEFTIETFKNKEGGTDFYIKDMESDDLFLLDIPYNYKITYKHIMEVFNSKRNGLKIKELEAQKDQLRKKLEDDLKVIDNKIKSLME